MSPRTLDVRESFIQGLFRLRGHSRRIRGFCRRLRDAVVPNPDPVEASLAEEIVLFTRRFLLREYLPLEAALAAQILHLGPTPLAAEARLRDEERIQLLGLAEGLRQSVAVGTVGDATCFRWHALRLLGILEARCRREDELSALLRSTPGVL
ncbi:MAG TPA: hypothetical protein ENK43_02425 [Planctomycetes bacterium]|nr:hypothetical protein [Planctomycetota bacterium]